MSLYLYNIHQQWTHYSHCNWVLDPWVLWRKPSFFSVPCLAICVTFVHLAPCTEFLRLQGAISNGWLVGSSSAKEELRKIATQTWGDWTKVKWQKINDDRCTHTDELGCRIVFGIYFASGFGFVFWLSFPVPFALYLQQSGTRTCRFAWYLLHLAMFAFHFAWYLSYFGISTSHLHGICYILVLQTFMWVS